MRSGEYETGPASEDAAAEILVGGEIPVPQHGARCVVRHGSRRESEERLDTHLSKLSRRGAAVNARSCGSSVSRIGLRTPPRARDNAMMLASVRVTGLVLAITAVTAVDVGAQSAGLPPPGGAATAANDVEQPAPAAAPAPPRRSAIADLFKPIPRDFVRLFTIPNALIAGAGGAGAVVAHQYDDDVADSEWGRDPHPLFAAGQYTGDVFVNIASGLALYTIGRTADVRSLRAVGSGVFRAQLVSQSIVQTIKPLVSRERPDQSNDHSFPSGHSATSFATATVLRQEWGWKAGLPAYAVAAYTGISRVHNRRHYVSDVVFGATVGVLSGRAVTIGRDELTFALSVGPTHGGWRVDLVKVN